MTFNLKGWKRKDNMGINKKMFIAAALESLKASYTWGGEIGANNLFIFIANLPKRKLFPE